MVSHKLLNFHKWSYFVTSFIAMECNYLNFFLIIYNFVQYPNNPTCIVVIVFLFEAP
jgi:hypothetical protein